MENNINSIEKKYFKLVNELKEIIQTMPYKQRIELSGDILLSHLKNISILENAYTD